MRYLFKIAIPFATMILIIMIGMLFYHNVEGWTYTDSFYFSGVTVLTIGDGDHHPTNQASKIFTVFYAFAGIADGLVTLTLFGQFVSSRREKASRRFMRNINKALKNHKARGKRRNALKGPVKF